MHAIYSVGQKGGGLVRESLTFPCDDHYRPTNGTWAPSRWAIATREKRHNIMTQMTSLLAVATVLLAYGLILQSGREGAIMSAIREPVTKVEFELKVLGAYAWGGGGGGGRNCGQGYDLYNHNNICVWEAMRGDSVHRQLSTS